MIALFKRRPILFWKPRKDDIIQADVRNQFPTLQTDFGVVDMQVLPDFQDLDNKALIAQNQFRWQQIILIVGGVITAALGGLQAALPDDKWPGITEGIIAALLTAVGFIAQSLGSQKKYYSNRLKAELLRGEYFLFLGKLGTYNDDSSRVQNLIRRVTEIQSEEK